MLKVNTLYKYLNIENNKSSDYLCKAFPSVEEIEDCYMGDRKQSTIGNFLTKENNLFLIIKKIHINIENKNKNLSLHKYTIFECFRVDNMTYFYIPFPKNDYLESLNVSFFKNEFEEIA